jgi:sulfur carrier protein
MSDLAPPSINLLVNGRPQQFVVAPTITELLATLGMAERRVAVEVNREIVPRGRHPSHRLADGDQIELVQAMGGG